MSSQEAEILDSGTNAFIVSFLLQGFLCSSFRQPTATHLTTVFLLPRNLSSLYIPRLDSAEHTRIIMAKSVFLASALAAGTIAQTTTVMNLFLYSMELGNITLHGSVISAAPDATTYSITSVGDADCTQVRRTPTMLDVPGLTLEKGLHRRPATNIRQRTINFCSPLHQA